MGLTAPIKLQLALVGAAIVAFLLVRNNLKEVAAYATSGAVKAVEDVATGTVLGMGDAIGIPRTNETACQKAMRENDKLEASFACPATTFLDYMMHGYIDPNNKGLQ